jgi:hypothetical protein
VSGVLKNGSLALKKKFLLVDLPVTLPKVALSLMNKKKPISSSAKKFRRGPFQVRLDKPHSSYTMSLTMRWMSGLPPLHNGYRPLVHSFKPTAFIRHRSTTITFPPSQKRPLARRLLKPLSITACTALAGTALYYNHKPSRHFICALERCGRAGLVGIRVAINYKIMLSKTYQDEEEASRAESHCHLKSANLVLAALKKSGGIYIKLGQHASAMVYILPPEWTSTMAVLQDQCPPTPYQEIEELFQKDMGMSLGDLFSEFDPEPIGVASLAQVHRAKLRENGQEVAVKMQHPFLDEFCRIDIDTVSFIFGTIKRIFPDFGFEWLSEEMNESLPQELNFVFEANNANKVRENFKDLMKKRRTALVIPEIVWAQRRILCMECKCKNGSDWLDCYLQSSHVTIISYSHPRPAY